MTAPLVIERFVAAPPARVWSLWTTTDGLAEWWWTFLDGTTYEIDARDGGHYRIENTAAGFGVHGEFVEITPGERFVATWIWIDDGTDGLVEHFEVRFEPDANGTRLTIVHDGPWTTPEPAEAYAQGWADTLDRLDLLVA